MDAEMDRRMYGEEMIGWMRGRREELGGGWRKGWRDEQGINGQGWKHG